MPRLNFEYDMSNEKPSEASGQEKNNTNKI